MLKESNKIDLNLAMETVVFDINSTSQNVRKDFETFPAFMGHFLGHNYSLEYKYADTQ